MLFPQKLLVRKSWAALLILALVGWCYVLTLFRPTVHSPPSKPRRPAPAPDLARVAVGDGSRAYVFYATANTYACSALVNAHRLRNELNSSTPVVLIAGPDVNASTLRTIAASPINITIVHDTAPPLGPNSVDYYAQVLLKLRAFRLHHVLPDLRRIVVLDSDQLVRKNLDHLFALPAADVAAPLMYWGGEGGRGPAGVTTALMVATLSEPLWAIVDGALRVVRADEYDMDIVNRVLHRRLMVLPGRYCTLNSHWEACDTPGWFKGTHTTPNASDADLAALDAQAEVLHFTALGKPWDVVPAHIDRDRAAAGKPAAHPLFAAQFAQWHDLAGQLCAPFWDIDVAPLLAIAPPAAGRLEPSPSPQPQPSPRLEPSPTPEPPAKPNGRAVEVPPLPS